MAIGATSSVAIAAPAHNPFTGLSANQIAAKAAHDLQSARAVHMYSAAKVKGKLTTLSLTISKQGCWMKVTSAGAGSLTLLTIGKSSWVQPDDQFWKALGFTGAKLAAVHGKWLTGFPSKATCSTEAFGSFPVTGWVKGSTGRSHGVRELALIGTEKIGTEKKSRVTMWVSIATRPLVLSLQSDGAGVYFGNYNVPVKFTPPPPGDVISNPPSPTTARILALQALLGA